MVSVSLSSRERSLQFSDFTEWDLLDIKTNNNPQPWLKGHLLWFVFTQEWSLI